MKIKNFNLQRALDNVENVLVETTEAVSVTTLSYNHCAKDGFRLVATFASVFNKTIHQSSTFYYDDGTPNIGGLMAYLSLKPKKKEGWINIYDEYECSGKARVGRLIYDSEDAAKKASKDAGLDNLLATVKITWEE